MNDSFPTIAVDGNVTKTILLSSRPGDGKDGDSVQHNGWGK